MADRKKGKAPVMSDAEGGSPNSLWAWGANAHGQTGALEEDEHGEMKDTQPTALFVPSHVGAFIESGVSIVAIACGQYHTLVLASSGDVYAWGRGDFGVLGLNSKLDQVLPRHVDSLPEDVIAIAAGLTHSLALTASGAIFAWGEGRFGKLGQGRGLIVDQVAPVELEPLHGRNIKAVFAGGNSSAAIDEHGEVWTWGWNANGQLGLGFTSDPESGVPVPSRLGSRAKQAVIDVIDIADKKYGWADRTEAWGALIALIKEETNAQTDRVSRTLQTLFQRSENTKREEQIKLIKDVVKWGATDETSSKLLEVINDVLPLMGITVEEEVGTGEALEFPFKTLVFGERHCAALTAEGTLWTWGGNAHGQLGDGSMKDSTRPRFVPALKEQRVISLSCGMAHTAVVTEKGSVFTWGWKQFGRLGYDIASTGDSPKPTQVECGVQAERCVAVACGEFHTVALTERAEVWTWGYNINGQLGYREGAAGGEQGAAAATDSKCVPHFPVKLRGFAGARRVYCGNFHTIAMVGRAQVVMQLCRDGNVRALTRYIEAEGIAPGVLSTLRDETQKGATALHAATVCGNEAMVDHLVHICPSLAVIADSSGRLPLHIAAHEGHSKCVKILVGRTPDPNAVDRKRRTALHVAARQRFNDIAQLLVIHGASLSLQDSQGKTPEQYMTREDAERVRRLTGTFDVVLSHAPEQAEFAQRLCAGLSSHGVRTWVADASPILEEEGGGGGGGASSSASSASVMERRLGECRALVWVVSTHAVASSKCKAELMLAKRLKKALFPLWFEVVAELPSDIEQVIYMQQLADFSDSRKFNENVVRLSREINKFLERSAASGGAGTSSAASSSKKRANAKKPQQQVPELTQEEEQKLFEELMPDNESSEYVFVAYDRGDRVEAATLAKELRKCSGMRCFLGATRAREASEVSEALAHAHALVFVLSQHAVENVAVREQIALAENRDVLLFSVPIETDLELDHALRYTLARAPRFPAISEGESPAAAKTMWRSVAQQLTYTIKLCRRVQTRDRVAAELRSAISETRATVATRAKNAAQIQEAILRLSRGSHPAHLNF